MQRRRRPLCAAATVRLLLHPPTTAVDAVAALGAGIADVLCTPCGHHTTALRLAHCLLARNAGACEEAARAPRASSQMVAKGGDGDEDRLSLELLESCQVCVLTLQIAASHPAQPDGGKGRRR